MIKSYWFFAACCLFALLVCNASAAIYPVDNTITVSLKYNNGDPAPSESFMRLLTGKPAAGVMKDPAPPADREQDLINVISVDTGTDSYSMNYQTVPMGEVYISSTTREEINVMQVSTEPGYPALEIYWTYDKSLESPWQYYMRVDNLNDGYATLSEFRTSVIWRKPMTASQVQAVINSGSIPDWESVK